MGINKKFWHVVSNGVSVDLRSEIIKPLPQCYKCGAFAANLTFERNFVKKEEEEEEEQEDNRTEESPDYGNVDPIVFEKEEEEKEEEGKKEEWEIMGNLIDAIEEGKTFEEEEEIQETGKLFCADLLAPRCCMNGTV